MTSSVIIYGLNYNVMPYKQEERGVNQNTVAFHNFVKRVDARVSGLKVLIDANAGNACFCYVNYESESDAVTGKLLLDSAIFRAVTHPFPGVDTSRMYTCMKTDAPKRKWVPVFTIWIGNIFDKEAEAVRMRFNAFGPLATMTTHGIPPFKIAGEAGPKRSALINYIHFTDAKAALDACAASAITVDTNPPVIARPRTNVLFVQRVLRALAEKNEAPLTIQDVHNIANRMGGERPVDCIALLHACTDVLHIDPVNGTLTTV